MARTRGAKSSSPSNRKKSLRKEPVPDLLQSLRRRDQFPPVKPRHQSRRQDDTLPGQEVGHCRRRPRCRLQFPRRVPASSIAGTISGAARKISGASSATSEPQIQAETALEEVIGGQCYLSPQLRETWIVELGIPFRALLRLSSIQSEAGACPIIPAAEEVPYGASASSKRLFLSPDSHGFLSIHDNQRGQESNLIHFTIDGRHGILGARHIAEALQIPFEPTQFDNFRAWANPTELEMVRTLSRGAANRSHLLRGELPPVIFD
ncbi:hypothetical protein CK203_062280 [Vitis vinifera]|uniref:Uncharacterized protein n=1 Tax=Vitis vinifera TaxID=29760 RepID=A0A438GD28_VITVI|nr:hypothetical protein CK203_062280 [Vitis vinifera]